MDHRTEILDLRTALEVLRQTPGQLVETDVEVDPAAELSGVYRYVGAGGTVMRPTKVDGPAMVFHNIKGHPDTSVAIGVLASRQRVANLFGAKKEELGHLLCECAKAPIQPVVTDKPAPCQEVVHKATDPDFDLFQLVPAPTNTPVDAGPYITLGMCYATHPDTGLSDVTIHRMCIQSKDELSIFLQPGSRHIGAMAERATELGRPLPISVSIGVDPAIEVTACFEPPTTPLGFNELSVAGALRKRPVELCPCLTVKENAIAIETHEQTANVATISAGDELIGEKIAEAMEVVGKDGVITVEDSQTFDITIDTVEGMQFDKGYVSAYFVTDNDRMEAVMKDPFILITDQKISSVQDIMPVLEAVQRAGRGLLIIAEDIDGEALPTLVLNKIRGALNVCAVKAPGYGDRRKRMLEDIAVLTGGQAALDELGVKVADITADMLGTAKSVTISKDNTTIVGGAGSKEAIDARIAQIKGEMENTTSDFDREKLQERLAKLSGGVAVIKVGAATESELKEIKHRVEDALQATRAAVEEGIVAGGGVAFMDAAPALDAVEIDDPEEKIGVDIVKKALTAPVATIAKNAGFEGAVVVDKVAELPAGQGLNSANGEWGDMIEMGVLDPVKVSRVTLQNAASVASLILITEATVSDVPKNTQLEDAIAAATAGQQGGGMY